MMRRKKPKPLKIPRPKVKELRKLYQALVTASVALRIEALKTILQWYDQAMPYVDQKVPLDLDRAKLKEKMLKARRVEVSRGATGPESETAFLTAVKICESYCKTLRPAPIDKACAKYDLVRARMAARQQRLENRFQHILKVIRVLKPNLSTGDPMPITVSGHLQGRKLGYNTGEFLYSRDALKRCQALLRQKGSLPLLLEEIRPLSRAAAQKKNAEGHFVTDLALQLQATHQMLDNLVAFFQTPDAPKRLIKPLQGEE